MTTPSLVQTGTLLTGSAGATITPTIAGCTANNLLVLAVAHASTTAISTPTGWTAIVAASSGGSGATVVLCTLFYRLAAAGTNAPSITTSAAYATQIAEFTGIANPLALDGTTVLKTASATNPTVTTSASTVAASDLCIGVVASATAALTYVPVFTAGGTSTTNLSFEWQWKVTGASGSTQTMNWTNAGTALYVASALVWKNGAAQYAKSLSGALSFIGLLQRLTSRRLAATARVTAEAYSKIVLADAPLAYYRLNDATTSLIDASGNAKTMTAAGTVTAGSAGGTGDSDTALALDGTTGRASLSSPWTTQTTNWSLEALIYPTAGNGSTDTSHQRTILFNGDLLTGYGFNIGGNSGVLGSLKLFGLYQNVAFVDSGYTFPALNQWYHVVMTRDTGSARFYVNGIQTPNTVGGSLNAPSGGAFLGCDHALGSFERFFQGTLDEVAIYGTALSATQIAAHYAAVTVAPLQRSPSRLLSAGLSFVGALTKSIGHTATGALSFSGVLSRQTLRSLSATLSESASTRYSSTRAFAAVLQSSGTISPRSTLSRLLMASLNASGTTLRQSGRQLTAALPFIGAQSGATARLIDAALSVTGRSKSAVGRMLSAALSSVGAHTVSLTRQLSAAVTAAGAFTRTTTRTLDASLALSGFASFLKHGFSIAYTLALTAAASVSGTLSRQTTRSLSSTLSSASTAQRAVMHPLLSVVNMTGTIGRSLNRPLLATLQTLGALSPSRLITIILHPLIRGFRALFVRRPASTLSGGVGDALHPTRTPPYILHPEPDDE